MVERSMDPGDQSWAVLIGWIVIGLTGLFGVGLLFSRPTNIERPIMVGFVTLAGTLVATWAFRRVVMAHGPDSWLQAIVLMVIPVISFTAARLVDQVLGGTPVDREADKATYGAHLSD